MMRLGFVSSIGVARAIMIAPFSPMAPYLSTASAGCMVVMLSTSSLWAFLYAFAALFSVYGIPLTTYREGRVPFNSAIYRSIRFPAEPAKAAPITAQMALLPLRFPKDAPIRSPIVAPRSTPEGIRSITLQLHRSVIPVMSNMFMRMFNFYTKCRYVIIKRNIMNCV